MEAQKNRAMQLITLQHLFAQSCELLLVLAMIVKPGQWTPSPREI